MFWKWFYLPLFPTYRISLNRNRPLNSNRPSFKNCTNRIPLQLVIAPQSPTAHIQLLRRDYAPRVYIL